MASSPGPDHAPRMQADVLLSAPGVLSDQDERLLLDVLSDCGADTSVETLEVRRGFGALTWIVLASLPLQAFLSALGSKAADDSYAKLRALVRRLAAGRHADEADAATGEEAARPASLETPASPTPLILMDSDTGLRIVLEADLPAEAYSALVAMDLSQFRFGPLHYDQVRQRWRSELDEAAG